jgi:O-antigen/teichoic acid export membrane protein
LGVVDFGIYNVVGGFVIILGFLNNAMASATQRFLAYEIGINDFIKLTKVFRMSVNIHIIIGFIILILAEVVGLWFINTQLTIPPERLIAANWVYQFSLLSFLVGVVTVPYNALIIAHERMNVFAIVSIVDVGLRLIIVFLLQWIIFDKLQLYAFLIFLVSLIVAIIYGLYCRRNFRESKFRLIWDKELSKTLIGYAGWNLWGNAAGALYGQGVNLLLNIFFGPAINAARGIAYQVLSAVNGFVYNFQMALNPQIVKSYAVSDLKYMHELIFQGSKYSFFLISFLSLPILIEAEMILHLWLKVVPDYTVIFTRLVMINVLIDCVSGPLMTAAQATGKIRLYQSVVGGLLILILPISWFFLKLSFEPQVTLYVSICVSIVALIARLLIISPLVKMSVIDYFSKVIFKVIPVILISLVLPLIFYFYFDYGYFRLIAVIFTSLISVGLSIFFLGIGQEERSFVIKKISELLLIIKFKNE